MQLTWMPLATPLPSCDYEWTSTATRPENSGNTKGSSSSGVKVWVTPLGNAPRPAEVTDEKKGNLGWIVEEGNDEYQ